jgi:hypothetical protein
MMARKKTQLGAAKPRKPRAKKAPVANGSKPGDNGPPDLTFDEKRALFLSHNGSVVEARAKVVAAKKILDFPKKEFDIARDLASGVRGETKIKADVTTRLRVARYIGHKLGAQYDLFAEPDRTPAVDTAYDAGKMASMNNEPRKPPHAPETEQYRAWVAGYNDHQGTLGESLGRGAPETGKDGEPIKSGTFVPRSAFSKAALDAGVTGPEADAAAKSPLPPAAQQPDDL